MHEEKFSGLKRTPNVWQIKWTLYNTALDNGKALDEVDAAAVDPFNEVPDFFLYELTKAGLKPDAIAAKLKIPEKDVQERLAKHIEFLATITPLKAKLDDKADKKGEAYRYSRNNIG